jgi:hypothetical protein
VCLQSFDSRLRIKHTLKLYIVLFQHGLFHGITAVVPLALSLIAGMVSLLIYCLGSRLTVGAGHFCFVFSLIQGQ